MSLYVDISRPVGNPCASAAFSSVLTSNRGKSLLDVGDGGTPREMSWRSTISNKTSCYNSHFRTPTSIPILSESLWSYGSRCDVAN